MQVSSIAVDAIKDKYGADIVFCRLELLPYLLFALLSCNFRFVKTQKSICLSIIHFV